MPHIPHIEFVNGPEFPSWRKSGLDLVEVGCRGHSPQAQDLSLQLGELGREDSAASASASTVTRSARLNNRRMCSVVGRRQARGSGYGSSCLLRTQPVYPAKSKCGMDSLGCLCA